jgi:hypothetical protein
MEKVVGVMIVYVVAGGLFEETIASMTRSYILLSTQDTYWMIVVNDFTNWDIGRGIIVDDDLVWLLASGKQTFEAFLQE